MLGIDCLEMPKSQARVVVQIVQEISIVAAKGIKVALCGLSLCDGDEPLKNHGNHLENDVNHPWLDLRKGREWHPLCVKLPYC